MLQPVTVGSDAHHASVTARVRGSLAWEHTNIAPFSMKQHMTGGLFGGGVKTIAAVASTGAAVVSILTALNAWGLLGTPIMRESVANLGVRWIGIRPSLDTARAVHDTLHLAATVTDKNGSVVESVRPTTSPVLSLHHPFPPLRAGPG